MASGETKAAPNGALEKDESDYFALAVHMKEDAGNEYRGQDITIDVQVVATQMASESDSFGNQYDADATMPGEESSGDNLFRNSGFEEANGDGTIVDWTLNQAIALDTTKAYSGNNSLKIYDTTNVGTMAWACQGPIAVESGATYRVSGYVYVADGNGYFKLEACSAGESAGRSRYICYCLVR